MTQEIRLRKEAMRRVLAGESKVSIGEALDKTRHWVSYWVGRYDPDDPEGSLQNRSSAPFAPHREWPDDLITQVLTIRRRRVRAQAAGEGVLIGAEAIHSELRALGVDPTPPVRTIHYWLKQAGLIPEREPQEDSDTNPTCAAYPLPARETINAL